MLPDFPQMKRRVNRNLLRFVRAQIPLAEPLLHDVTAFAQHEGKRGELTREDASTDSTPYQSAHFPIELPRDEMRTLDLDALRRRLTELAERIAASQTQLMLTRVGEAAASVGNEVDVAGEFGPEHFLEAMRKVHADFDPATQKPKPGFTWVMHPDTAAKVLAQAEQWEKDPAFIAELKRIEDHQREEWRAREARRVLAD